MSLMQFFEGIFSGSYLNGVDKTAMSVNADAGTLHAEENFFSAAALFAIQWRTYHLVASLQQLQHLLSLAARRQTGEEFGAQYMDDVLGESSTVSSRMGSDIEPILSSVGNNTYKKLNTVSAYSVHLLISAVISFVGILMAAVWPEEKRDEAYFIMTCLRVVFWILTFLFDHLIRKRHNELRMNGYHDFHRCMAMQNGIALNITSAWNTMLLMVQALLHHYYGTQLWDRWFTPITCIAMFQTFETLILVTAHVTYIVKVHRFNNNLSCPDALAGANTVAGSLGLMQPGGNVAELLEKQADLIAYLKDHNQKLNQKLHQMQLTAHITN